MNSLNRETTIPKRKPLAFSFPPTLLLRIVSSVVLAEAFRVCGEISDSLNRSMFPYRLDPRPSLDVFLLPARPGETKNHQDCIDDRFRSGSHLKICRGASVHFPLNWGCRFSRNAVVPSFL